MAGERRLLIDCPPRRRVTGATIFPTPPCKKPPRAACLTGARPQNDGCMNDMLELISFGKASAPAGVSIRSRDWRQPLCGRRLLTEKDHVSACSAVVAQAARAIKLLACCSVVHKRDHY